MARTADQQGLDGTGASCRGACREEEEQSLSASVASSHRTVHPAWDARPRALLAGDVQVSVGGPAQSEAGTDCQNASEEVRSSGHFEQRFGHRGRVVPMAGREACRRQTEWD